MWDCRFYLHDCIMVLPPARGRATIATSTDS